MLPGQRSASLPHVRPNQFFWKTTTGREKQCVCFYKESFWTREIDFLKQFPDYYSLFELRQFFIDSVVKNVWTLAISESVELLAWRKNFKVKNI